MFIWSSELFKLLFLSFSFCAFRALIFSNKAIETTVNLYLLNVEKFVKTNFFVKSNKCMIYCDEEENEWEYKEHD